MRLERTFRDDRRRYRANIVLRGETIGYVRRTETGRDYYAVIDGVEVASAPTVDGVLRELRETLRPCDTDN